jgi:hypothetical protein
MPNTSCISGLAPCYCSMPFDSFAVPLPPIRKNPNQPRTSEKPTDSTKQYAPTRLPPNEGSVDSFRVECDPARRAPASMTSSEADSQSSTSSTRGQFTTQSESDLYRPDPLSAVSFTSSESLRRSNSSPVFMSSTKLDQNSLRSSHSMSHPRFIQERGSESWRDLL